MQLHKRPAVQSFRHGLRNLIEGPQILALLPALTLAAFWLGGEVALLACALGLPAALALIGAVETKEQETPDITRSQVTSFPELLHAHIPEAGSTKRLPACLILQIDDFKKLEQEHDADSIDLILQRCHDHLELSQRETDIVHPQGQGRFAILIAPEGRMSLDGIIQIAQRMQNAIAKPISLGGSTLFVTASVGFCLGGRAPHKTGQSIFKAAHSALQEALHHGPAAIRAFTTAAQQAGESDAVQIADIVDIVEAFENGDIKAWFQPQISTESGEITGVEALARWEHPQKGVIPPAAFLPLIQEGGLSEQLSSVMLIQGLTALKNWQKLGYTIPTVGVNFSSNELRNPKLVDHINWELDRFDLSPDRLTLEVLETVIAGPGDDMITRNLTGLSKMGCGIDLDDFGTGHASIANIRRFSVDRIKIDRSLVRKLDEDQSQKKLIAAILVMAEQLEVDTLAEGVETIGEHAALAQLGCAHVQGFGIARPMPFADCSAWIEGHNTKLSRPAQLGRNVG